MPNKVDIAEKLKTFDDHWNPRVVGDVNDAQVKLVKIKGEFVWHHHEVEDELFLVLEGKMRMRFRDKDVDVGPGEFIIVPHGVEHMPMALTEEVSLMLFEPKTTLNTGNVREVRTRHTLQRI
jgi:mannose-6-phosphate isomerase-like protein (cupin superfamily)